MANFNILGQTINSLTGFVLEDTGGTAHTFYEPTLTTKSVTANGTYTATSDSADGYSSVTVAVPEPTLTTKSITANGTYAASSDSADGYSSVTVNVSGSGGGSSSWTLVASTSYTVSTTSTSAATVATWSTGASSLWTGDKFVWMRIRDSAGARDGYFYGSDMIWANNSAANGITSGSVSPLKFIHRYASGTYSQYYTNGTAGYGVFADYLYSDGRIRIRKRYNSTYSLTVNGTYTVEVYLLTPPSAIFT